MLKNRFGGSDFGSDEESGSLGTGATLVKLQVALDSNWAESGNIMQTLSDLAARRGTINGRSEISSLLSDVSIALLRKQPYWNAASISGERFGSATKVEPAFQKLAIQERTKFENEVTPMLLDQYKANASKPQPTQAIVSLIVAIRGKSDALQKKISPADVVNALQSLASEALTDEGENILAVEVLWTPSERGEILSERDMIADYPELIRL